MGSRKDLIKRSLGITEYPWSSDDELEEATLAVEESSLRRPPSEPRPSTSDASGSSGLPPPMSQQHQQQQSHQMQQQQSHQMQQQQSHQVQQDSQQQAASRRCQARHNRNLFWSIINSPYRISNSHPRPNEVTIPRISHVPAPGVCGEQARRGPRSAPDVKRIMEFKRLARNINTLRSRSFLAGGLPVTRVNPGVIVPSEANSGIIINRHAPARTCAMPPFNNSPALRNGGGSPASSATMRWLQDLHDRYRMQAARVSTPVLPHAMPVLVHAEEDEVNNNPVQQEEHLEGQGLSALEETSEEPDVSLDDVEVVDLEANGNVPLEEEIVAIDLDSNEVAPQMSSPVDEPRAGTSTAAGMTDETDGRIQTDHRRSAPGDAIVAGSSDANGDMVPEQSNHVAKRKHRDSDESLEPCSVQEFNQNLLRLLECPVCLEWMEPPISQCRRGHLVCGRCRTRLASCPVCRTTFSSVRNRAMEGVAELLRYPCRHGCGREVRLRRRAPHEASCIARKYHCPAPLCADAAPMPRASLSHHFQSHHLTMMKIGRRHKFSMKVNSEQHDTWLILAMDEYFHLKIDVDIRTWGVVAYVSYIGPKCEAKNFTYEVTIDGQHNQRKLVYARTTHSDMENSTLNVSRQDCFHLTLDQALNFIRFKNRHCDADKFLDFNLEIAKVEPPAIPLEESDS